MGDYPMKTKYHWSVERVIQLENPIPHDSNCRFPRVMDLSAREALTNLLKQNNEVQSNIPKPKEIGKVFCEHCFKPYAKQKSLENHLKRECEYTGDVENKRKAISNF